METRKGIVQRIVPGSPAPQLSLPTLDGARFDLRDARGRPLLLTFLRHAG